MLHRLKKLIPPSLLDRYHLALSWLASAYYGHPSEKLFVIGVTGTNGKTTVSYLASKALEGEGAVTGCTTTALFKIGKKEWLNDKKMTMLGRFQSQRMLRDMLDAGCEYVVVEVSSQGILQHRHRHINFDVCVFTNLTPEHIEAHGGFENYKKTKIELFAHLAKSRRKTLKGKKVEKAAVLNRHDEHAKDFAVPGLDRVKWFGVGEGEGMYAKDLQPVEWGTSFTVGAVRGKVNLPGEVNVLNAVAALSVAEAAGIPLEAAAQKVGTVKGVPGRFERVDLGQPFQVIVDYAPEPASLSKLYDAVRSLPHERLIHVLGSCGGGRDAARRPILGEMAGKEAQLVVVTNEDPYDDDPMQIMKEVAEGAKKAGKSDDALKIVADRQEAIEFAVGQAKPGDIVLLTGKGCEQAIMGPGGSRKAWDEREAARKAIKKVLES